MEQLRLGDFEAWREYQSIVIERTTVALEGLTEEMLCEVVVAAVPPSARDSFCGLTVGVGSPIRKLEVLECFVFQHGVRHLGELEHARALVGLRGMSNLTPAPEP